MPELSSKPAKLILPVRFPFWVDVVSVQAVNSKKSVKIIARERGKVKWERWYDIFLKFLNIISPFQTCDQIY